MQHIARLGLIGVLVTGCTFSTGLETPPITDVTIFLDRDTIYVGDTVQALAQGYHGDQYIWVQEARIARWTVDKPALVRVEGWNRSGASSTTTLRALSPGTVEVIGMLNGVEGRARLLVAKVP